MSEQTASIDRHSRRVVSSLLIGFVLTACGFAVTPGFSQAAPQGPWVLPAADLSATSFEARNPQVAIGPDGTTIAVWQSSNGFVSRIQAAVRPPGGSFGTPADLSAAGEDAE
ncbi:MAG: hypothetical protein WBW62_07425, partial [Solirubrobacterales bacterium]